MRRITILFAALLLASLGFVPACARYDASGSYVVLLLLAGSASTPAETAPATIPWADSSFAFRRKVEFGASHSALPLNYTVFVSMDTRAPAGGVSLASGDDVRVYWQPTSGAAVELDRVASAWNSATSVLGFRLQSAIDANLNEDADGSYYVYYGNSSAGTPPSSEANVFYFADFFDRANGSTIGGSWTEWRVNGTTDMVLNGGRLRGVGNDQPMDTGVRAAFPAGAPGSDFVVEVDWHIAGTGVAQATWIFFMNLGQDSNILNTSLSAGVGPGLYFGEGASFNPNNTYNMDHNLASGSGLETNMLPNDAAALQPLYLRLTIDPVAQTYTYTRSATPIVSGANIAAPAVNYTSVAFLNTGFTVNAIRFGLDGVGGGVVSSEWDNLRIYLKAADEPETTLSAAESL